MNHAKLFTGNSNRPLANAVAACLGMELGKIDVGTFSDGEVCVEIRENVRGLDCFVVQSTSAPANTHLMELLIVVDALRRSSARRITAVIPYYGYARQDRKVAPRAPITAKLVADLISVAGADRVLCIDLHAGQIQGFFNIPLDELTALFMISRYFKEKQLDDLVVVATDVGASKRARNVAQSLNAPLAVIEKRRVANDDQAQVVNVIGEVEGKRALLVDEEINTGGTILNAVDALKSRDVTVFSGDAPQKFQSAGLAEVVITDTVPMPPEKMWPAVTILSIAPLIGEAISRIHTGRSIGELFQMDDDGAAPNVPASMVGAERG
jgi:ribose-phosphate pyrophosphokinase